MASERKLQTLPDDAKQDTQIAACLTTAGLLSDQGLQSIAQVLKGANDPVQALAHVIFIALAKVREKLQQQKINIDPKVWIAGGGVLDRVMFELMMAIATILKFHDAANPQFVAQVKSAVLDLMHSEENPDEQEPDQDQDDQQQQGGLASPQQAPQGPPQGSPQPQPNGGQQ